MAWLNTRQSLLAQNVANGDVPGYEARDLKPLDFEQVLKNSLKASGIGLAVTDSRHISPQTSSFEETVTTDPETIGKGNSVSPEEEMMKVSDTQAQYQAATNLYAKSIQMMRTAIDR
jgi:flagellar basal-body rod protein FlgB